MSIVSWNVHRCIGTDRHYEPGRIAEVLASLGADVIALQEVDSSLKTVSELDQLTYIGAQLQMQTLMSPTLKRDYGSYGNALLARGSFEQTETLNLSFRKYEPRGATAACLSVGERRVRLINTHFGLKYWERAFQTQALLNRFRPRLGEATLLVGDFNEWFPFTFNNARLGRVYQATPRLATFPSLWPRLALDRIWLANAGLRELRVIDTPLVRKASDHLPLFARVDI